MKNFLFQLLNLVSVVKKKKKKKKSRSNDFGNDEYSYSILYSDPRISENSDTGSSPKIDPKAYLELCYTHSKLKAGTHSYLVT